MQFFEKTIARQEIFAGRILNLRVDTVELQDGKTSYREIVDHKNAVAVLPIVKGQVYFVKQFRKAVEKVLTEIPAGMIETEESSEEAAKRELQEEIGLRPKRLFYLGEMLPSPGFTNETTMLYYADKFEESRLTPDDDEFIQVIKMPIHTVKMLFDHGKFTDAKTACALGRFFSLGK